MPARLLFQDTIEILQVRVSALEAENAQLRRQLEELAAKFNRLAGENHALREESDRLQATFGASPARAARRELGGWPTVEVPKGPPS
jgi:FtsZ-binding cell division protein ZapB